MHDAVNAAVVEPIESGIVSSCSLMVPCPAAANAMRLLRERPHISFGIHLAIIRDSPECRWGPAAAKADVPSLLHPDTNELYVDTPAERTALLATAKLTEVERELRAQIDAVVDAGLAPTHLPARPHRMGLPSSTRHKRWAADLANWLARPAHRPRVPHLTPSTRDPRSGRHQHHRLPATARGVERLAACP